MSKIRRIKAEIERLKNELSDNKEKLSLGEIIAVNNCYNNLIFFIDSLSDTEKDFGIKESVIPFGASDSELMEATYFIPQGYHAVIEGDKVIIKKGEEPVSNDLEEESKKYSSCIYLEEVLSDGDKEVLKERLINTFKAGAQWQKERDQSTIELAENHAYLAGQEKIIEKACVWLNNFYSEDRHCYLIKEDIDNFKKAMEE